MYKHYVVHPQTATDPALAACAAANQGKFGEMEKIIWEKGFKNGRKLDAKHMETLAQEVGLNMNKYKADVAGSCKQTIQQDQRQLAAVGARGTPAFFINGRFLSGAQPIARFKAIIDEELKKADDAIKKGAKVETYYAEQVVKKGQKKL